MRGRVPAPVSIMDLARAIAAEPPLPVRKSVVHHLVRHRRTEIP
jgi:hypothetical protein